MPPADDIRVPWTEAVRMIAREAAQAVIREHLANCEVRQKLPDRVRSLEMRFARLVGFMAGAGILGGLAGNLLGRGFWTLTGLAP